MQQCRDEREHEHEENADVKRECETEEKVESKMKVEAENEDVRVETELKEEDDSLEDFEKDLQWALETAPWRQQRRIGKSSKFARLS